jgi:hypothetical protein
VIVIQGAGDGLGMWYVGDTKGRVRVDDLHVDGKMILKWL